MKKFVKKFGEFWTNLSLNIRDYFIWVFNYKKLKEEWQKESLQNDCDLIESQNKIKKINNDRELIQQEKDKLIKLRDDRIGELNKCVGKLKRKMSVIEEENNKLKADIKLKEESRHSSASKVGALQKNINRLEKELKLANDKIEFLKNNRKSPSLEELKAYEYSRREVLKRQNERKD